MHHSMPVPTVLSQTSIEHLKCVRLLQVALRMQLVVRFLLLDSGPTLRAQTHSSASAGMTLSGDVRFAQLVARKH